MTEHFQVLDLSHVLFGGLLENGDERFTCIILRVRAALAAASRTGLVWGNGSEQFRCNFVLVRDAEPTWPANARRCS